MFHITQNWGLMPPLQSNAGNLSCDVGPCGQETAKSLSRSQAKTWAGSHLPTAAKGNCDQVKTTLSVVSTTASLRDSGNHKNTLPIFFLFLIFFLTIEYSNDKYKLS